MRARDLSVVVAARDVPPKVTRACLRALFAQTQPGDVMLVTTDRHDWAREFPDLHVIDAGRDALTPALWQIGIDAAHGEIVALTIAGCTPPSDWLHNIRSLFAQSTHDGIGGALDAPVRGSAVDWAVYFARYSAYLPPIEPRMVDDVAGDNAAYRRAALDAVRDAWRAGFWEIDVHRALRARGQTLALVPDMTTRFTGGVSLRAMARQRWRHGRQYGATRRGSRVFRIMTSPAIPLVLALRIIRRVRTKRPDWMPQVWRSLPALLVLIGAWSAGEIVGLCTGRSHARFA